ncbi:hypothetical protein [Pseudoalteromonas spongiae]|uniref:hypothetical protein n=1 Tax=Pseudoalteromonas spongiae TaxID=298657 RepID=UPI000C2D5C69|nr:hypothetical protein [Pseudoalteromonas spongiae]
MVKYTNQQANLIISHAVAVHEARYGKRKEYEIAELINVDPAVFSKAKGNSADKRYLQDHHLNELVEEYGKPYGISKGVYLVAEECLNTQEYIKRYHKINHRFLAVEALNSWNGEKADNALNEYFKAYGDDPYNLNLIKERLSNFVNDEAFIEWANCHEKIQTDSWGIPDKVTEECDRVRDILHEYELETLFADDEFEFFEQLAFFANFHDGINKFRFENSTFVTEEPTQIEYVLSGHSIYECSGYPQKERDYLYRKTHETFPHILKLNDSYKLPYIYANHIHSFNLSLYRTDSESYYCLINVKVGEKAFRASIVKINEAKIVEEINLLTKTLSGENETDLHDLKVKLAEAGASISGVTSLC